MRSVLGFLRFGAAAIAFCAIIALSVDVPGSVAIGAGVAWADGDDRGKSRERREHDGDRGKDHDRDDDDDDDDRDGRDRDHDRGNDRDDGKDNDRDDDRGDDKDYDRDDDKDEDKDYDRDDDKDEDKDYDKDEDKDEDKYGDDAGNPAAEDAAGDDDRDEDDRDDDGGSANRGVTGDGGNALAGTAPDSGSPSLSGSTPATASKSEGLRNSPGAESYLVALRTGSWNRPYYTQAVRGTMLALNVSAAEIEALEGAGFRLMDQTELGALGIATSRFRIPPGRTIGTAVRIAQVRAPGAVFAPDYIYQSAGDAELDACVGPDCQGPALAGWEQVAESCGAGIRIGMTDTGIDRTHPALRGRALRTETFDPFGEGSVPDHGTAVAGLLVGNAETGFPGMLPGAELFAADVFHTDRAGESYSTLLSLVQGLDWLVDNGVSVVNVSMTGPPNALLEQTVARMNENGIVVVAAAGNGGPTAPPAFPAAYDEVVSVTAVDRELRPYSMANRGAYISFSSPGVGIWSAGAAGSGQLRTGTSFAAAHASAIIADVIGQGGPASARTAIRALQNDARDLGAPGKDPVFGWGLIHSKPACRM